MIFAMKMKDMFSRYGSVWGISDDIERSRSFARTLRQSQENRWWTAKYNNGPKYDEYY